MAIQQIKIESILGGKSPSKYFASKDQFLGSAGIDPEQPIKDTGEYNPCGLIRPTSLSKFSGSEITGVPLWIVTNPKTTNIYVYANDGKVHTVTSALAMGTALNSGTALSSSSGNGAAYYDNYIYFAKNADIARYGPLNGTPTLTQTYWTSTLSLTAPTDTTYPTINTVEIPNHPMHRHTDDKLYFGDVTGNQGILSYVKTKKTTVEGDTDDSSAYNALDFDYGYYPTAIESFGTDLAVALVEGTDTTIKQNPAAVTFWDTTSDSFSKIIQVEFPDPFITAMKNINGILYVFSGSSKPGCRVSRFVGGYTFEEIAYIEDIYCPMQGAVDHIMNRIIFGGAGDSGTNPGVVHAIGGDKGLTTGIHGIYAANISDNVGGVSAIKYISQSSTKGLEPIVGWFDTSFRGLDKISTTYPTLAEARPTWRSQIYRIGEEFQITKIEIPLGQAMAANMTIIPKIFVDDATTTFTLDTINNTNFSQSEKKITLYPDVNGFDDFYLQLQWNGTALAVVALPIIITLEILDQ